MNLRNDVLDQFRPQVENLSKRSRRAFYRDFNDLKSRDLMERRWSQFFAGFGNAPGIGAVLENFESAFTWGPSGLLRYVSGYIASTAIDSGNTPTTTLRPGLVMGITASTGAWTNYSPTATDGSQVAAGVLPIGLPMLDPLSGLAQNKAFGILCAGGLQASKCIGLDLFARANLVENFLFDDFQQGVPFVNTRFPWSNFVTKTANYQVLSTDNLTLFDNTGATGAVTFTLPAIANGYFFAFRAVANQNLLITSTEGSNIVGFNNATASTISFQTGSAIIGGQLIFYTNPAKTQWIVESASAGANTVTTA